LLSKYGLHDIYSKKITKSLQTAENPHFWEFWGKDEIKRRKPVEIFVLELELDSANR